MNYETTGAESTIQNGCSARLALQLSDLQALANALVPNLVNNAKTRPNGRAVRVYGQWDNYRTNFDDFRNVYLLGIQLDIEW